ncbi:MAG TPA: cytochrome c biogenesis protein CcdA [Candidatus Binataceae bacterium]
MFKFRLAILAMLALLLAAAPAAKSDLLPKSSQVVRIESIELIGNLAPGGQALVEVTAQILSGWHINSDRPSNPDYIPTSLGLSVPHHVGVGKTQFPVAQLISPAFSGGEVLSVFTGRLRVKAVLLADSMFKPSAAMPITATIDFQPCNDAQCLQPASVSMTTEVFSRWSAGSLPGQALRGGANGQSLTSGVDTLSVFDRHGYALGFMLVFVAGLALNLTPCVYPLIGITIAYFGNQGGGTLRVAALAGFYLLGIAAMFSALGVAVAMSGGLFGAALQNPYVLAAIASMLLLLAASSFGWFTIQPPSWMLKRAGNARPGYAGAAIMGLGMGVVAAPCIGPVVLGLLLLVERSASALFGFAVFFTLALGMGVPYIALALAAGSIRQLPRSGEWLAWVEQFFGLVLVGMALYFLDPLTRGRLMTHLLPFYTAAAALYLGFISTHGDAIRAFRLFKRAFGALAALGLLYLLIPRTPPPQLAFTAYQPGLVAQARDAKRPVVIDFAADWCIPCREMERSTYVDPRVIEEAARFMRLKADLTRQDKGTQEIIAAYEIPGVPTTIFIDSQGAVRKRLFGYVGPHEFLEKLRGIN